MAQMCQSTATGAIAQYLQPKWYTEIEAQMLVKHNDTFSGMHQIPAPLHFDSFGWWNWPSSFFPEHF